MILDLKLVDDLMYMLKGRRGETLWKRKLNQVGSILEALEL